MRINLKKFASLLLLLLIFMVASGVANQTSRVMAQSNKASSQDQVKEGRLYSPREMKDMKADFKKWDKDHDQWRTTGNHFNIITLGGLLVFFWLWVATTTWANCDAERLGDPDRVRWNAIQVSVFPIVFFLSLLIPLWFVPLLLVPIGYFVPMLMYVSHRNEGMVDADKVMTPEHIVFVLKRVFKMKTQEEKQNYMGGPPIQLVCSAPNLSDLEHNAKTILARNMPGYNMLRTILYNAMNRKATMVNIEFGQEETNFQFMIDGVWHSIDNIFKYSLKREEADSLHNVTKTLCDLNLQDRRGRQRSQLIVDAGRKNKIKTNFMSQGTPSGELFSFMFVQNGIPFGSIAELGASPQREQKIKEYMSMDRGLIVFSALPGCGLRTMTNVICVDSDRFMRDFVTVEDVQNPYPFIENIQLNTYNSAEGQNPMSVLPDVFFREPKVLLIRDLVNTETLTNCCQEIVNDRLIITTFRGKDSVSTLMAILKTGVDPNLLADSLKVILTQKLVRVLCYECREKVPVNPAMVQKLGLPANSVKTFYRKRIRPNLESGQKDTYQPCDVCQEIGYHGRHAIWDVLEINDEIRQLIITNPSEEAIRRAAARNGYRGYLEDGAYLIGLSKERTTFEELSRVLK